MTRLIATGWIVCSLACTGQTAGNGSGSAGEGCQGNHEPQSEGHQRHGREALGPPVRSTVLCRAEAENPPERCTQAHGVPPAPNNTTAQKAAVDTKAKITTTQPDA